MGRLSARSGTCLPACNSRQRRSGTGGLRSACSWSRRERCRCRSRPTRSRQAGCRTGRSRPRRRGRRAVLGGGEGGWCSGLVSGSPPAGRGDAAGERRVATALARTTVTVSCRACCVEARGPVSCRVPRGWRKGRVRRSAGGLPPAEGVGAAWRGRACGRGSRVPVLTGSPGHCIVSGREGQGRVGCRGGWLEGRVCRSAGGLPPAEGGWVPLGGAGGSPSARGIALSTRRIAGSSCRVEARGPVSCRCHGGLARGPCSPLGRWASAGRGGWVPLGGAEGSPLAGGIALSTRRIAGSSYRTSAV